MKVEKIPFEKRLRDQCVRCIDNGLSDDEKCPFYGEPNGCNHPFGGIRIVEKSVEKVIYEIRERYLAYKNLADEKPNEKQSNESVASLLYEIAKDVERAWCLEKCHPDTCELLERERQKHELKNNEVRITYNDKEYIARPLLVSVRHGFATISAKGSLPINIEVEDANS